MNLLLAASLVTALALTLCLPASAESGNAKEAQLMSIHWWATREFLDYFLKCNAPTEYEAKEGQTDYEKLKDPEFPELSSSSFSTYMESVPVSYLQEQLKSLQQEKFTSESELKDQLSFLALTYKSKTIREHINEGQDGEFNYGTTALMNVGDGRFTYFATYTKFKLNILPKPTITYSRTNRCVLWDIICQTIWKMENDEGSFPQITSIVNYLRAGNIKDFLNTETTAKYIELIRKKADESEKLLPETIKDAVKKIARNPDKRADELFQSDPIDLNKYD